jgi:hypothetical protein
MMHSACFVQMDGGLCVDLLAPDLSGVPIGAFAVSLSRLPRFLGRTRGLQPYSVAQHSLLVAEIVTAWDGSQWEVAAALLHDAHKALMGDVPTPVKRALGAPLELLEQRLQRAVFARFGLGAALTQSDLVREADATALAIERRDLLAPSAWPWPRSHGGDRPAPAGAQVTADMPAALAEARWLLACWNCPAVRA